MQNSPPPSLMTRAPLALASSIASVMYAVRCRPGNGVIVTPFSHGMPILSLASSSMKRCRNNSAIDSCTISILSAVQRCPLNESVPSRHSLTVNSMFRVGENDRGVLGIKAENCAQPVRLRMLLLEMVGDLAGADQR